MLRDLFLKTDKPIFKWNHYFEIYEELFSSYRNKEVKILEIGILGGGSLSLWKEYFGDKCKVVGIDIDPTCKKYEDLDKNISVYIGSTSDSDFLSKVIESEGYFDIVIDDGAHTNLTVMTAFKQLSKVTNHIYVVEDTHSLLFLNTLNSFFRDIYACFAAKHIKFSKKITNLASLVISILRLDYSFYNLAKDISSKITTDRHGFIFSKQKFYKDHKKLIVSSGKLTEFVKNLVSISFFDSLIIFKYNKNINERTFAEKNF